MKLELELQSVVQSQGEPKQEQFEHWAMAALDGRRQQAELVVRIVDEAESSALNQRYRGIDRATNILSFPFEPPPQMVSDLLGDLVICAPVVSSEAQAQGKSLEAHWAHLVVHGVLHLLGFDHQDNDDAEVMEAQERVVLERLGFPDPYHS